MRLRRMAVPFVVLAMLTAAAACGDDDDEGGGGGSINVLNATDTETEGPAIQEILDEQYEDADYDVEFEASGDFEQQLEVRGEGGTLDVALVPQPGAVREAVNNGAVALEDLGFDIAELEELFGEYFVSLGEVDGKHYGLPTNINLKSMIWYPKDDFDEAGYEVPETWEDLIALSDEIVSDGGTPWCVGFESEGGSSGWPATDWMEDIMLRTAGTEIYDQWVNHEIPFDDEAVVTAGETFGEVMFGEDYVLGGAAQTPSIAFTEAPSPMFDAPPGCWLHRQATFINTSFPEDAEAGTDYDWFPFPPIDEEGTLFAGEFAVTYKDTPEIRDFLERFMGEDVQCAMADDVRSSRVSPNTNVGPDCYANEILADASEVLTTSLEEGTGRFDASDMMPPAVGSGTFWTAMLGYMQDGPDSLEDHLGDVEASWPEE